MKIINREACIACLYIAVLFLLHGLFQANDTNKSGLGHGVLLLICVVLTLVLLLNLLVFGVIPSTRNFWLGKKLESTKLNSVHIVALLVILLMSLPCELLVRWNIHPADQVLYGGIMMVVAGGAFFSIKIIELVEE